MQTFVNNQIFILTERSVFLLPNERKLSPQSMLSDVALQEFKQLYLEEYGQELSDAEALELGVNLLTFMNAIYKPVKKEWLPDNEEKNYRPTE